MRILILEPDPHFRQLVRQVLEPAGHEVLATSAVNQALALYRATAADLVLCCVEPGVEDGPALIEFLETQRPAPQIILFSAFYRREDESLKGMLGNSRRRSFLAKPFSMLDLADQIHQMGGDPTTLNPETNRDPKPGQRSAPSWVGRTPARDTSGPTLPPAARVDPRNVALLARLWATSATGVLSLSGGPNGNEGWANLKNGDPVDHEATTLVVAAIRGGRLSFENLDVASDHHDADLGELLWRAVRNPMARRFALEQRFQALARTPTTHAALRLPLTEPVRRLLTAADGQTTLGELMAREGLDAEAVSVDLHALQQLRMLGLQMPVSRPWKGEAGGRAPVMERGQVTALPARGTPAAQPRPEQGEDNATVAFDQWEIADEPPTQAVSDWNPRRPDERRGPGAASGSSHVVSAPMGMVGTPSVTQSRTPSVTQTRTPSVTQPRASGPHSSLSNTSTATSRVRAAELRERLRNRSTSGSGSAGTTTHLTRNRTQLTAVMLRLRREAGDLASASPAVVLGIPADSTPDLVRRATERMRDRYRNMLADPDLPAEARDLAKAILARVEEAAKNFTRDTAGPGSLTGTPADLDRLVAWARDRMDKGDWDAAEKVLARARQLRMDDAGVLANLAWARFNNPRFSVEVRTREARELLVLAEQFDPNHPTALHYLAEVLSRAGEIEPAFQRASRAIRLEPDNQALATLFRRLKARKER